MKYVSALSTFALLFFFGTTFGQNDPKAKKILDDVTKKVNTLKTIKANFTLSLTGAKVKDSKSGDIAIKGAKYHVKLTGQEIMCDGKTVWTYNPDAKEVTITKFNPQEQGISPAKLLTNFYDKEYTYKYSKEIKVRGKSCDVIELTPKDASKQVKKIELIIDKSTTMIAGGKIWSKNGNQTDYSITQVVQNSNIPDNVFAWDPKSHQGVETNDLR